MLSSLFLPLTLDRLAGGVILSGEGVGNPGSRIFAQHPYLAIGLACLEALALAALAAAFLFLAWRISWGVQQFVMTCRQRQKTEARLVDMFRDYVEVQRATSEQFWSASAALSPC